MARLWMRGVVTTLMAALNECYGNSKRMVYNYWIVYIYNRFHMCDELYGLLIYIHMNDVNV